MGLASERMVSRVSQRRRRPSRLWRERIREDVARVLRDVDRGGERHPPACPHVPPLPRVSPICGLLRLRSPARALRFTQLHELRIEKAQPPLLSLSLLSPLTRPRRSRLGQQEALQLIGAQCPHRIFFARLGLPRAPSTAARAEGGGGVDGGTRQQHARDDGHGAACGCE